MSPRQQLKRLCQEEANDAIIQRNILTFVFIHKHTVHEVRTGRWDIISIATWCGGRGVMERGGNNKQESLYCGGNAIIRRDVTRHSSWCHPSTPRGHKTSLVSAHCCPIWVMMSMSFIKINFTSPTYKNIKVKVNDAAKTYQDKLQTFYNKLQSLWLD